MVNNKLIQVIKLSSCSKQLLRDYCTLIKTVYGEREVLSLEELLSWFNSHSITKSSVHKLDYLLLKVHLALLKDLRTAFEKNASPAPIVQQTLWYKSKLLIIASAGLILAACEGFDSFFTMMGIFKIPLAATLACGMIFSLLSVMLFCIFDLSKISSLFNLKFKDAFEIVSISFKLFQEIRFLRKFISDNQQDDFSSLRQKQQIIYILQQQLAQLQEMSKKFKIITKNHHLNYVKWLLLGFSSMFFFGGGFCAGQTVAVAFLGLFLSTITPASWPVIAFGVLIGLAACVWNWHIEFPALKTVVNSCLGLNEEQLTTMSDINTFRNENKKLVRVQNQLKNEYKNNKKQCVTNPNKKPLSNVQQKTVTNFALSSKNTYRNTHRFFNFSGAPRNHYFLQKKIKKPTLKSKYIFDERNSDFTLSRKRGFI